MKWKTTLVLLIATVGIGTYVSRYELRQPSPERRQELARQVVQIAPEAVTELAVAAPTATLTLAHQDGTWRLTRPIAARADQAVVQRVLDELNPLESEQTLTSPSAKPLALAAYGLEPPRATLTITENSRTTTLRFGDPTPVGHNRYLALAATPPVWVVSAGVFEALDQPVEAFRSHELLNIEIGHVRQVTIASAAQTYTLTKMTAASGAPETDHPDRWQLTAPLTDAADSAAVSTTLSKLRGLRIEQFIEETRAASDDFAAPYATITIGLDQDRPPLTLTIGRTTTEHPEQRAAKRSDEPFLYTVASTKIDELLQDPQSLRDKACFEFFASQVTKLRIASGTTSWTVEKTGEAWKAAETGRALDGAKVEEFLWKVRDVRATRFVDETSSDVARDGLDPAQGTVQVWLTGPTEPQTLVVGSTIAPGSTRYGRIAGRSAIVELPEAVNAILTTTPDAFTPTPPPPSKTPPAP